MIPIGEKFDWAEWKKRRAVRWELQAQMEQEHLKQRRRYRRLACAVLVLVLLLAGWGPLLDRKPAFSEDGGVSSDVGVARTAPPEEQDLQLDDPLLVLVNDAIPVPQDWTMELTAFADDPDIKVDSRIYPDLMAMLEAARQENVWFWITSGYRSEALQQELLEQKIQALTEDGMTRAEAEKTALRRIQRPGHSEHHTGLTVDFNNADVGFENTDAYWWLCEHAAEYGFVQRYRSDKADLTGIDDESWHYRYVGRAHALRMTELDLCLEEYVQYLRSGKT